MVKQDEAAALAAVRDCMDMLEGWLARRLPVAGLGWFREQILAIRAGAGASQLGKALGWAPRRLGKSDLALDEAELAAARRSQPGFDPGNWSVDQAARVAFVLACYRGDAAGFARQLDALADTAEIYELVALYRGFALYPGGGALEARARAAVRSAMRPVFEAIAHRNPYPATHFDAGAWNQMVVKTFFLETPLWPVQGLEWRANPPLARMLVDLAHERWAAGRAVSPELWRCVVPHADEAGYAAVARVLADGGEAERLAVALSLPPAFAGYGAGNTALQSLRGECQRQGLYQRAAAVGWSALSPWRV